MNDGNLTPNEWYVMECLWSKGCCTGREAVEYLQKHVGWSRSTTLTMLRRMDEKGMIRCEKDAAGLQIYFPNLNREEATLRQTEDFLHRVYNGSIGMMLSAFTKKQSLTREEIDELYAILDRAKKGAQND